MGIHNAREIVIDGHVETSILPSKREELLNTVVLRKGYHIQGGLYAADLSVTGGGTVEGPVVVKNEIRLFPDETGECPMMFACGLNSTRAIQVHYSKIRNNSPSKDCAYTPVIIRGDVCTNVLRLDGVVLTGNVMCNSAHIKDTIVFGNIRAQTDLHLENSIVLSFSGSSKVLIEGRNSLLMPYASANGLIEFKTKKDDVAQLRYVGCCPLDKECPYPLCCRTFYDSQCPHRELLMTENDIFDGVSLNLSDKVEERIITIISRISNTSMISQQVAKMTAFLRALNRLSHIDTPTQAEVGNNFKDLEMDHLIKLFMMCSSSSVQNPFKTSPMNQVRLSPSMVHPVIKQ